MDVFHTIILLYAIILIPFYHHTHTPSKALIIFEYVRDIFKKRVVSLQSAQKTALLAWAVKLFFAPLMIVWFTDHFITVINNLSLSSKDISLLSTDFLLFFNTHLFWVCFTLILSFDVFFFTLGYLIESPKLKNTIKSVEPTILGWVVVLACYPPFNSYTTSLIGWYSNDFPMFSDPSLHIVLNGMILLLMGIYASASVSLGWKASNLTNRGIITSGAYSIVRHPAYITKNLAWWIGGLPLLIGNIQTGQWGHFCIVFFSLLAWSAIYYLRAITEERHLSKDPEYRQYTAQVRYKFIPGIW